MPAAGFQGRAGRNTLIGPSFRRTDLSLAKRFPMGGQKRFEFCADIYNVLNNVNFGQPAANISNANAGIITQAAEARSMQPGFRVIWQAKADIPRPTLRHAGGSYRRHVEP